MIKHQNTQHGKKQNETFETRLFDMVVNTAVISAKIIFETLKGMATGRFPWALAFFFTSLFFFGLRRHWDYHLMQAVGFSEIHPLKLWPKSYNAWWWFWISCPSWSWGIYNMVQTRKTNERYEELFTSTGLKNRSGKTPRFKAESSYEDGTFKKRFRNEGFSLDQLKKTKPNLESAMGVYIDDIKVNTTEKSFEIVCSQSPMPELVYYQDLVSTERSGLDFTKLTIGTNRTKTVTCDLKKVPHILVAGETSSGKSTFIRQAVTTLYKKNEKILFSIIDLKAGLESNLFEGKKRFKIVSDISAAENHLKSLNEELDQRFKKLKDRGYTNIGEISLHEPLIMPRRLIVIDEVTELFYGSRARGAATAREIINRIARQGRAAGFHLIIGTQRPDARSLDTHIKANLGGKLCFKMADTTSSVIVLGNAKAKNLPAIAGRGIWQSGMDNMEIQTPFLSIEEAKEMLGSINERSIN